MVAEAGCYLRWQKIEGGCVVAQDVIRADIDFRQGVPNLDRDLPAAGAMVAAHLEKMRRGEV